MTRRAVWVIAASVAGVVAIVSLLAVLGNVRVDAGEWERLEESAVEFHSDSLVEVSNERVGNRWCWFTCADPALLIHFDVVAGISNAELCDEVRESLESWLGTVAIESGGVRFDCGFVGSGANVGAPLGGASIRVLTQEAGESAGGRVELLFDNGAG